MTVVVLAAMLPAGTATAQAQGQDPPVERIERGTPVETSVAIAQLWEQGSGGGVIARHDDFADALASGLGQAISGGPMFLTPTDGPLPASVRDELTRQAPPDDENFTYSVPILGGDQAVSQAVEDELTGLGYDVPRYSGPSRLETAIEVSEAAIEFNQDVGGEPIDTAILVRAFADPDASDPTQAFADSLAAGAWSAENLWPVLLTQSDQLSDATARYLTERGFSDVKIVGGTAAVSDDVAQEVRDLGITVERVAGPSRDATASAIAEARDARPGRMVSEQDPAADPVVVVEGSAADAWVGGFGMALLSAVGGAPIVLSAGDELPPATVDYLSDVPADQQGDFLICVTSDAACDAAAELRGMNG